eukprot:13520047-Heterocapsa_arctica.AAC.1
MGGKGNYEGPQGNRNPTWGCPCGTDGNWACRPDCRQCGKSAPSRIREAAIKAQAEHKAKGKSDSYYGSGWSGT